MWIQAGDNFTRWLDKQGLEGDNESLRADYARYLEEEIHNYYYGQCAEYCGDSHARMLFRATAVSDEAFAQWVADEKAGHTPPGDRSWDEWYALYDTNPDALTGDLNEGLKLFMGRAKCATCHVVNGNPRALGVAGPNLTNIGSRMSLAAGWLNHRTEDGEIDVEQQYDNLFKWLKEPDVVKPGNLMWKANGGGIGELTNEQGEPALLTEEEVHLISLYLQSLK
jgi:cytochrome c oxidase subunit 2